ncbi:MAG: bifunctional adenosylcobinamide kinase/adenosylcobinamide-phosphate guanylyltransferase [Candidatus Limnocylindria bacterium]
MLTLISGGARSGKSQLAQGLAAQAQRVCYLATARAGLPLYLKPTFRQGGAL